MTPSPPRPRSKRAAAAKAAAPPAPEKPFVAHLLVPPHELLSADESETVLKTLGAPRERLPKILASDPGLKTDPKYRAAREAREPLAGRLVRVRRPSPTAGEAVAYRIIIAAIGD
ncbi:MAG TPA: DNA-directed RNA polymerase subunit RpoH/Rpb5 C-terminal domain-containing protein [Thermoplasmata archaeon]|nr:DNA-directed RNA polymerase subunit RpoH/Rpb5 C-terminal domain-containing protein [Thermoplasmata archaeon]